MQWFEFLPADTLYFRGAEPMNMGESHTASSLFPPPPGTLSGALRTAVLIQNGIPFHRFHQNDFGTQKGESTILKSIGQAGTDFTETPFQILGPLFRVHHTTFFPVPLCWFAEKEELTKVRHEKDVGIDNIPELPVVLAKELNSSLIHSSQKLFWAKGKELQPMTDYWTPLEEGPRKETNRLKVLHLSSFFDHEIRTGVALSSSNGRTARKGHLYSFKHSRLKPGVTLLFGSSLKLPLDEQGTLSLGAEKRFGRYQICSAPVFPEGKTGLFASLGYIPGNPESNENLVLTGKLRSTGGWDLKKKFHKPMRTYYPAGTLFKHNFNKNIIAI
jgi:CRISPR-associated protein Cmr3